MHYDLELTFRVRIAKWRVDDQTVVANRKWALNVYDEIIKDMVNVVNLDRPGEWAFLQRVEVVEE